jgi:predicted glutamine amidotransferase
MCGIFGIAGGTFSQEEYYALATAMAVATQVRGTHATGYAVLAGEEAIYHKAPLAADDYVKTDDWKLLADLRPSFLIGHCRFATHGKPEQNENNHPFISAGGNLAMVHNGVIGGHWSIAAQNKVQLLTQCDSEVILRVMETEPEILKGIDKVFKKVLTQWRDGAVAVLDFQNKKMHLFRNDARPCHVARLTSHKALIFTSTKEIMDVALAALPGAVLGDRFDIKPNKIYTITNVEGAEPTIDHTEVKIPVYETKQFFQDWSTKKTYTVKADVGSDMVQKDFDWDTQTRWNGVEEVQCPCGQGMWLFHNERKICASCHEWELQPGRAPVNLNTGEWLKFFCNVCGFVWHQKTVARRCLKCQATQIEIRPSVEKKQKKAKQEVDDKHYKVLKCLDCGLKWITDEDAPKCACGSMHFELTGIRKKGK